MEATPHPTLDVKVLASTQVHPVPSDDGVSTIPLSIIDSTVSYFSRCAATWFYDPPKSADLSLSIPQLQHSLRETLASDAYRPWTGRLSYTSKADPTYGQDHTSRYRRVRVTCNCPETDLGATFISASSTKKLADYLPSIEARKAMKRGWDLLALPSKELLPSTRMSLSSGTPEDAPNLIVQVTQFACGSSAIAIAITHGLADAQSMCTFARDWAAIYRALHSNTLPASSTGIFDPRLLDAKAAGDIDGKVPDASLVKKARNLPCHRFDWYKHVPDQPWPVHLPDDWDPSVELSPSDPIPWKTWDVTAAEEGRILHFTAAEVNQLYALANQDPNARVSKHDALLAHLWLLITHARQPSPSTTAYLNVTLGLRTRLSLSPSLLGSPIMITGIPLPPNNSTGTNTSLSSLALHIREHIQLFDAPAVGAFLHDAAFEVSPQRLWQTFLGSEHVLQTTWAGSGCYDVDFLGAGGPELRAVVPEMGGDGLLCILEGMGEKKGHWTANGVDVVLFLERSVMDRLLANEKLWGEGVE